MHGQAENNGIKSPLTSQFFFKFMCIINNLPRAVKKCTVSKLAGPTKQFNVEREVSNPHWVAVGTTAYPLS